MKKFTKEEIKFIENNWQKNDKEIAKCLNREVISVSHKRRRLGFKKDHNIIGKNLSSYLKKKVKKGTWKNPNPKGTKRSCPWMVKRNKKYFNVEHLRKAGIISVKKQAGRESMIEKLMTKELLKRNIKYVKQFPYELGVADFWLPKTNTIIECDGDYWHNLPGKQEQDKKQTEYLESKGYIVVRIWEHDINAGMFGDLPKT